MGEFNPPSSQPQDDIKVPPEKLLKINSLVKLPRFGFWVSELLAFPEHGAEVNIRLFGRTLVFFLGIGLYDE